MGNECCGFSEKLVLLSALSFREIIAQFGRFFVVVVVKLRSRHAIISRQFYWFLVMCILSSELI